MLVMMISLRWQLFVAWLAGRVPAKSRVARGSGSIGPILWIVVAFIIIGAVIAWWEASGSADLAAILGNFTSLLSDADRATAP